MRVVGALAPLCARASTYNMCTWFWMCLLVVVAWLCVSVCVSGWITFAFTYVCLRAWVDVCTKTLRTFRLCVNFLVLGSFLIDWFRLVVCACVSGRIMFTSILCGSTISTSCDHCPHFALPSNAPARS